MRMKVSILKIEPYARCDTRSVLRPQALVLGEMETLKHSMLIFGVLKVEAEQGKTESQGRPSCIASALWWSLAFLPETPDTQEYMKTKIFSL
jgi:hypothetical protein